MFNFIDQELIVYLDKNGNPTGETAPKLEAHNSHTRLHSAFSCYIFNEKGQLLVTQRAHSKKVWPGVWTNSVCGHPGPGEPREDAIVRRAKDELGMKLKTIRKVIPRYIYTTPPFNGIIEHEFCPVFFAIAASEVKPNPDEVEDYKWLDWDEFINLIKHDNPDMWSWWTKDQVKLIQKNKLIS